MHHERLNKPVRNVISPWDAHLRCTQARDQPHPEPVARMPSETGDNLVPGRTSAENTAVYEEGTTKSKDYADIRQDSNPPATPTSTEPPNEKADKGGRTRKPSKTPEPFDQSEREEMERLLGELRGHLGARYLTGD